tara:strand:- start:1627 stop:2178 length:552 start_codon:yes stop_codon:yes gene_type:complete
MATGTGHRAGRKYQPRFIQVAGQGHHIQSPRDAVEIARDWVGEGNIFTEDDLRQLRGAGVDITRFEDQFIPESGSPSNAIDDILADVGSLWATGETEAQMDREAVEAEAQRQQNIAEAAAAARPPPRPPTGQISYDLSDVILGNGNGNGKKQPVMDDLDYFFAGNGKKKEDKKPKKETSWYDF